MKKFTAVLSESFIAAQKAHGESKSHLEAHGFTRVSKDVVPEKYGKGSRTRYEYTRKPIEKDGHSYHTYLRFSKSQTSQRHGSVETTFVKNVNKHNGVEREPIDKQEHKSVKDAVAHLNKLHKAHL